MLYLHNDNKSLANLLHGVKYDLKHSYTGLKGSLKYQEMPKDYLENDDTAVFCKLVNVPRWLVAGGKASLEVHLKNKKLNMIYLVA